MTTPHAAMPPDQVPYYITWSLDARSFLYAFAVAVGTAVVFGLLPALQASRFRSAIPTNAAISGRSSD